VLLLQDQWSEASGALCRRQKRLLPRPAGQFLLPWPSCPFPALNHIMKLSTRALVPLGKRRLVPLLQQTGEAPLRRGSQHQSVIAGAERAEDATEEGAVNSRKPEHIERRGGRKGLDREVRPAAVSSSGAPSPRAPVGVNRSRRVDTALKACVQRLQRPAGQADGPLAQRSPRVGSAAAKRVGECQTGSPRGPSAASACQCGP